MRNQPGFRYFLGIRPHAELYPRFQRICEALGLPSRLGLLHLTLCVVSETDERDHFVVRRVQRALSGAQLCSFPVNLSRIRAGSHGASAHTAGRQDEIQDFYDMLVRLLRARALDPLHRKAGLHPHVTLGYRPCQEQLFQIPIRWFPSELMLIESEVGLTKHNVLERWSLLPPRQLTLFDDPTAAINPARRSAA